MSLDDQLQKFVENTIVFLETAQEIVKDVFSKYPTLKDSENLSIDPILIIVGITLLKDLNKESKIDMINTFILKSSLYWKKIKDKELSFLQSNIDKIIPNNPYVSDLQHFLGKNKKQKCYASDDDIEYLWEIFEGLVCISIKYISLKRETIDNMYPDIDIDNMSNLFEIELNDEDEDW